MADDAKKNATTDAPVEGVASKTKSKPRAKKSKAAKHVTSGRVYIQATYNNTIVTMTDQQGNVLAWSTSGHMGFRGPKKATPYAASMVVKDVADKVKAMGLQEVQVFVKGVGQGRDGAVRALHANGLIVLGIKDITPIPHNGPRAPKPRRI
jgi:small subunit ribosomal protein S11